MAGDPVKTLIKQVGRGKTLARDLSADQASDALGRILRAEFTDAQLGAFLQAMRIKETNAAELVGAFRGMEPFLADASAFPARPDDARHPLVVNVSYDTARKGGLLTALAAGFLRAAGLAEPLLVQAQPLLFPEPDGTGLAQRLAGRHPRLAPCPLVRDLDLCPAWERLGAVRRELGFRSILNTLEKVMRPWPDAPVVAGISHDGFLERLCRVLHATGAPAGAIVQGNHGTCDLGFGEKPTRLARFRGEAIEIEEIALEGLPWTGDPAIHLVARLDRWEAWLDDPASPLWSSLLIQASFLLLLAGGARTLAEAAESVRAHAP